ncbi:BnaC03g76110D [Brassica napus]|uniref:BnaC03g76110D protein n=1 Tax=Brassica napus TaxID=3708 RepID=A0A078IJ32_BRANA|nr:BnaC03g76110D [Brassica napus]
MCKKRFQSNNMKGYPLEDLYDTLGEIKVIDSVLVPTVDEEPLMARLMDGEPDYENEAGFPQKKDKRKVHEEASSSNTSLEDVEKMNKRLGKIESCQVVLKKRCKRMKAMEKKLEKIEDCQYYLKKKTKKRNDNNGVDGTTKEPEDADMVENTEVVEEKESDEEAQKDDRGSEEETEPEPEAEAEEDKEKEDEEESEEEAQKDDRGSEEEKEPEPEAEAEEDKEKDVEMNEANEKIPEKEPDEVQDEVEMNEANEIEEEVEIEARVEVETEKTPTPPRGRTKAAAARRQVLTTPEKLFEKAEKIVEEEVEEPEEEAKEMVEDEVEEPKKETEKYTEEEKQKWYKVVYEGSTCETKEADKGAAKPSGTGVKHRPKQMELRKQAPKGRPRKATQPKKFTTPEQTKRIRSRSQWVSTPFTEANTDEIEGRKKKSRTKA